MNDTGERENRSDMFSAKTSLITAWCYRASDFTLAGTCEYLEQSLSGHLFGRIAHRRQRLLQRLETSGVPAWGVTAVGIQNVGWARSRIVLQTRDVGPAISFESFFRQEYSQQTPSQKRRFVVSLGRYMRRLHDAGIVFDHGLYDDLLVKAENLSISFGMYGRKVFPVKRGSLSPRQRIVSLAGIYMMLHGRISRIERWRCLSAYLGGAVDKQERRLWLQRFASRGMKRIRRTWWRLGRRCLENNDDYVKENRDGFVILRQRGMAAESALKALLPDPDRLFENAVIYKPGSRTHAGQIELAGRRYFLKRYNRRSLGYGLLRLGRLSRARRTWLVSRGGVLRYLPIPRPIICLEEKALGMVRRSYILMDFVEQHQRLWHIAELPASSIGRCLYRFGVMVGGMHASGFSHGDLKWDNILIDPQCPKRISLVDFDGSRVHRQVRSGRVKKDLRRFCRDFKRSGLPANHLQSFMRGWRRGRYLW